MTSELFGLFGTGILETLYMVIVSTLLAYIIGIPMGIILNVTSSSRERAFSRASFLGTFEISRG